LSIKILWVKGFDIEAQPGPSSAHFKPLMPTLSAQARNPISAWNFRFLPTRHCSRGGLLPNSLAAINFLQGILLFLSFRSIISLSITLNFTLRSVSSSYAHFLNGSSLVKPILFRLSLCHFSDLIRHYLINFRFHGLQSVSQTCLLVFSYSFLDRDLYIEFFFLACYIVFHKYITCSCLLFTLTVAEVLLLKLVKESLMLWIVCYRLLVFSYSFLDQDYSLWTKSIFMSCIF